MTPRPSISRLADDAPVASADSWPARPAPYLHSSRAKSKAMERACAALQAQAARTARALIKDRARAYALSPRELDAISPDLSSWRPWLLVERLKFLMIPPSVPPSVLPHHYRHFGFGGEVPAINLRGAMLYSRYARAKAHQIAGRRP
jgi:hypothetical protein